MTDATPSSRTSGSAWLCIAALAAFSSVGRPAAAQPTPTTDWLDLVPADARLFVEVHHLAALRDQLQKRSIWNVIEELAGRGGTSHRTRADVLLGVTSQEAVDHLMAQRTAIVAIDPNQWGRGLVFADLPAGESLDKWLARWQATRLESIGAVQTYSLRRDSLRLAVRGRLLVLGLMPDRHELWKRTVDLLAQRGGPALAQNVQIKPLLARLPPDCTGWGVMATSPESGASSASSRLPHYAVAGFTARDRNLEVNFEWIEPAPAIPPRAARHSLMSHVPPDALACWSAEFDPHDWLSGIEGTGAFWRVALGIAQQATTTSSAGETWTGRLGPGVVLWIGRDRAVPKDHFEAPIFTLLVEAREPPRAAEDFNRFASLLIKFINTQLARAGAGAAPLSIDESLAAGTTIRSVDIGQALSAYTSCPYLASLQLAWAQISDCLIVSTSRAMVAQSIEGGAASPPARTASRVARQPRAAPFTAPRDPEAVQWLCIRGPAVADMLQSWIVFASRTAPQVLQPSWWHALAQRRLRDNLRLGVTLRGRPADSTGRGSAEVLEVEPDSPATGILRPGDVVVAAEGQPLTSELPAKQVADRFRDRASTRTFSVEFTRNGETIQRKITLGGSASEATAAFNPVHAIWPPMIVARTLSELQITIYQRRGGHRSARIIAFWQPSSATNPAK